MVSGRAHPPRTFFGAKNSAKYLKIRRILPVFGHFEAVLGREKSAPGFLRLSWGGLR